MALNIKLPTSKASTKKSDATTVPWLEKPLPLIGKLTFNKQFQILGVATGIAMLVGITSAVLDTRATSQVTRQLKLSGDLVFLTQRLAKDAASAMQGKQTAIEGLPLAREEASQILAQLDKGGDGLAPATGDVRAALDALLPAARAALSNVEIIEEGRPGILTVSRAVEATEVIGPQLREAIRQWQAAGGDPQRITRFALLAERIGKDASAMLGGQTTTEAVADLGRDTQDAEEILATFNAADPAVAKVIDLFDSYRNSVEAVISQAQGLFAAKQAVTDYFDSVSQTQNGPFLLNARALVGACQTSLVGRATTSISLVAFALVLVLLALLAKTVIHDSRARAKLAEATNKQNQQAILRLMNELSDLADGDLSAKATVTEDITGAIADSINYTTDELRKLVSRVISASAQVSKATGEAGTVTKGLMLATQKQADEIRDAGGAVELMTKSIKEVDTSAAQSSQVARRTLEVTEQGAAAVRNTVAGMDSIREQIQDTAKRIKRLGESSQEIGEIVDLISDITEQTNVLALNAAIQASSAGEAGRGFAVVAAEVQRLAERSAEATKQIGLLVKAIQGDTQDAVSAMEKSTQGVVDGARLSDEASKSLKEIESSTRELTDLVNSISVSTQVQTDMAQEVATVMADILKISEQTSKGTQQTSASVVQLEALAKELNGSVAGFKP
ncbi:MAG: methyl-accepting chemotaxis protein [Sideroxydans sp.]